MIMKTKIKRWLIWTFIILFLLYGLIYHTYVILFFLFLIIGGGYLLFKGGSQLKKLFDDLK